MKVDRRNPRHWWWLALFLANALVACVLRPFLHRRPTGRILYYGHKLSGNLAAILDGQRAAGGPGAGTFLTMDPAYHRELIAAGQPSRLASSPSAIGLLATADVVVCDHGVHSLLPLLLWSDLAFVDVWHGIPFKGFDATDFSVQHRFDECWVASRFLGDLYVRKFGFDPARIVPTGYARTDALVAGRGNMAATRRAIGLPPTGKVVAFAPTWKQDAFDRPLYPFGVPEPEFLGMLSETARRHGASVILRTHLNSGDAAPPAVPGVHHVPFARFADTEQLLLATDVLVCDWSSIAFDYLLLHRPTIFLDVPPPFNRGFSLDGSFRFGAVVGGMDALQATLEACLGDPAAYMAEHGGRMRAIREHVYGDCADGGATSRCLDRLARWTRPVATPGSSR